MPSDTTNIIIFLPQQVLGVEEELLSPCPAREEGNLQCPGPICSVIDSSPPKGQIRYLLDKYNM